MEKYGIKIPEFIENDIKILANLLESRNHYSSLPEVEKVEAIKKHISDIVFSIIKE